jgi:hypothetical protein
MRKFYLMVLVTYCLVTASNAQMAAIITANPGTSGNVPLGTFNYAASESIYTEAELGGATNFTTAGTAIDFIDFSVSTVGATTTFNNVKIYLKDVLAATTTFSTGTYSTAGYTLVYNGSVVMTATGWKEITLATPYIRAGGTNLQMLIERTDAVTHTGFVWNCAQGNNISAAATTSRRYNNTTVLSAATSLASSTFRPAVKFLHRYNNDASAAVIYTLGKLPIPRCTPHAISASISNEGLSSMTNVNVTLNVTGANTFTDTKTIASLASLASNMVTFNAFTPSAAGINTVTVTVAADDYAGNNSTNISQDINATTWSYGYGATASGGMGFNGATGDFVAKFTTNAATAVNQVTTSFFTGGQNYQVGIWDATGTGGTPGTNLWTSATQSSVAVISTIPVSPAITVGPGDFYVGIKQIGTTLVSFAYQIESPIRSGTFYYTSPTGGTAWTDFAPANSFRLMIEPGYASVLPIKIEYFNGTVKNSSHVLDFKVNCSNTQHAVLIIESSNDGRSFSAINSTTETAVRCLQPFNYINTAVLPGNTYYRIKMIDDNGAIAYSSTIVLKNGIKGFDIINISPNPVTGETFKLNITSAEKMQAEIYITDITGRTVAKQNVILINGFNPIDIHVANLAKGVYQLFGITALGRTKLLQFVKQ